MSEQQQALDFSGQSYPAALILDDPPNDSIELIAADFPEYGHSTLRLAYKPWWLWKRHELTCDRCRAERLGGEVCQEAATYLRSLSHALGLIAKRK